MKNVWHSQDKTKTILFATLSNTHTNTRTTLTLFIGQFLRPLSNLALGITLFGNNIALVTFKAY